jgi:hypothetical protein
MGDLERGAGALRNFQSKINALLTEFENSPGGHQKVAEHTIQRGAFSGTALPFAEADGFFTQYNRVHKELVTLSKLLADQMELLRLGAHAADVGFDNVDEDTRRRFHAIQTQLKAAEAEREQREEKHTDRPDQPRTDMPDVTKDMG